MIIFSYLQDGEVVEISFDADHLESNPLRKFYKTQVLNNDDNFNEVMYYGIYRFENLVAEENRTDRPEGLAGDGYLFVFAESEFRDNRAVIQMCFSDDTSSMQYRKCFVNKGEMTTGDWMLGTDGGTVAIMTKNPSQTLGGIWNKEEELDSKELSLWSQVSGIRTMAGEESVNALLDISTLALSGAQELYLRDTDNVFKKLLLDISCGGTGATTAAAARTALGAASQADLNSLRDSVSRRVYYNAGIISSYVGIDEYGPLLFLGFNEGEWWSLRLSHPQYDGKPAVFLTTVDGGSQMKWHG